MTDDEDAINHFVAFNVARGIDRKLALEYLMLTNTTNDVPSNGEEYMPAKVKDEDDRVTERVVVLMRKRELAALRVEAAKGRPVALTYLIRDALKRVYPGIFKDA